MPSLQNPAAESGSPGDAAVLLEDLGDPDEFLIHPTRRRQRARTGDRWESHGKPLYRWVQVQERRNRRVAWADPRGRLRCPPAGRP